jgi:hypothetical protein
MWKGDITALIRRIPTKHLLSTSLLYEEASMLPVQRRLVSESKLSRFQGSLPRTNQSTIFNLWDQYTRTETTTKRLLQLCSFLNGPTLDWWMSDTNVYFIRYLLSIIYLDKLSKLCICLYLHKHNQLAKITLHIETHLVDILAITNNIIHKWHFKQYYTLKYQTQSQS